MRASTKSGFPGFYFILPALFILNSTFAGVQIPQDTIKELQDPKVITVTSRGMDFDIPEEIPAGWTTFRYENLSPDTHFFVIENIPEDKTLENMKAEVVPIFSKAMELITAGNSDQGFAEFNNLPAWFYDVVFVGGPGLVSPGKIVQTTLELEPGNYVIECYVKMPDGQFHSALGMIEDFKALPSEAATKQPEADYKIKISSEKGIEYPRELSTGDKVFEVEFLDQKPHEHFVGHDVHLVKLEKDANHEELIKWMNWSDPKAFMSPAPKGVEFMGGTQEMPQGKIAYFNANLQPGDYAFIAEVPNSNNKNMFQPFSIPPKEGN